MAIKKHNAGSKKHFLTPARLALTFLTLGLVAALGISSCNSNDERQPGTAVTNSNGAGSGAAARNPSAPPALTRLPATVLETQLRSAKGPPIKLSNYAGKVVLVNLWATWCGPCRKEIPELVKFHKEFHSKGLEVVGLSTENPETSAAGVLSFMRDFKMDYPVGWATGEVAQTLMQGRDAIPQSFVIARDGRILRRFVGFNPIATPTQLREALEEALQ